jgi:hypothetical protein
MDMIKVRESTGTGHAGLAPHAACQTHDGVKEERSTSAHERDRRSSVCVHTTSSTRPLARSLTVVRPRSSVCGPLVFVQVRIQLAGEGQKGAGASPIKIAKEIIAKEGFGYLYKGLGAGLRQATYTTARLGLFRSMMDVIEKDRPSTFTEKVRTHRHTSA